MVPPPYCAKLGVSLRLPPGLLHLFRFARDTSLIEITLSDTVDHRAIEVVETGKIVLTQYSRPTIFLCGRFLFTKPNPLREPPASYKVDWRRVPLWDKYSPSEKGKGSHHISTCFCSCSGH